MRLTKKRTVLDRLKKGSGPKGGKTDPGWALIKDKYDIGIELRRPWEQRWLLNLAFFCGRQYVFFNQDTWTLQQLTEVKGKIRNVDNQLLPRVRRQISDAIINPPSMSVIPSTNDEEDRKAAKVGDKVLKSLWQVLGMNAKIRALRGWIHTCGNGFTYDYWDPKAGPFERKDDGSLIYAGDVAIDILGPFNILVPFERMDDGALNDFPWLEIVRPRHLEYFPNRYGEKGKEVVAEEIPTSYMETYRLFGLGIGSATGKLQRAVERRLFIKPCLDFPKGVEICGANGVVLEAKEYSYTYYPVQQFKDLEIPGVFHGSATMEHGVGLQKTWNRTISGMDEFNRVMGKGKWLIPRGSELEIAPDDTHGEMMYYTAKLGQRPELADLKGLPPTYNYVLEQTKVSFEDLFSQHEVTRGTNKSDIRSGVMSKLLLEQDARGNTIAGAVYEENIEILFRRVLQRVAIGYTGERILKITGQEGENEIFQFKGADLRGNSDVHVKRDSTMPESRAAREASILDKFETGLYGNPADPEVRRQVMNMLDEAVVENVFADTRLDESNARLENGAITQGGITGLMVNLYDDHVIHVREHNHFRKGRDYQLLKLKNPEQYGQIDLVFMQHLKQHESFIAEMMAAQIETEEKGGGGNGTGERRAGSRAGASRRGAME
jgi:hypothetical protein